MPTGTVAAIVPAAGRGERLGPGAPKALRLLGGEPLLVHAVRALRRAPSVTTVVVAAPPDGVDEVAELLAVSGDGSSLVVVPGGANRQESVRRALAAVPPEAAVVLVHDAARPLVPVSLVESVVAAVRAGAEAVIPVIPMVDTVKQVDPGGRVVATPPRAALRAVQTPQGFLRSLLEEAHRVGAEVGGPAGSASEGATDDAGLIERLGRPVVVVDGAEEAFKITRPMDLLVAEAVLAAHRERVMTDAP